jgi:hypothetical protein
MLQIELADVFAMAQYIRCTGDTPPVLVLLFSFSILPHNSIKSINIDYINNITTSTI